MPAATDKNGLIAITAKEFGKLEKLVEAAPVDAVLIKEEDTSIKDVIAHRAHWIELFLGWHADGQAGRAVHIPAAGYKWNDLKRYNVELRIQQKDMDWDSAKVALRAAHAKLMTLLEHSSHDVLYGCPMKGAQSKWSMGRFAEAAGASHYRSAAKYIRSRLRAL